MRSKSVKNPLTGNEGFHENYDQAISMTKEQVEKASEAFKSYDAATTLNKDSIEAVVKAGEVPRRADTFGKLTTKSRKPLLK